jgi:hypothetical protein
MLNNIYLYIWKITQQFVIPFYGLDFLLRREYRQFLLLYNDDNIYNYINFFYVSTLLN